MSPEPDVRLEQRERQAEARSRAPGESRHPADTLVSSATDPRFGMPLLRLQRRAGNAAVARLMTGHARAQPVVQRIPPPRREADQLPDNFEQMSDDEKAVAIRGMLGTKTGSAIYRAWAQLKNPIMIARKNPDLFTASMAKDDDIVDLAGFNLVRDDFERDVLAAARGYLTKNKAAIAVERDKMGIPPPSTGEAAPEGPTFEQDKAVQDAQRAAEDMDRVKNGKKKCLDTIVGYDLSSRQVRWGERELFEDPVPFRPGHPPKNAWPSGPTYDTVMAVWRTFIATEAGLVRDHPEAAFFIGEGGDPSLIGKDASIASARTQVANALTVLEGRIDKAIPLIGKDITFTDLVPIHGQLMAGPVWSRPMENAVAKETVSDANLANLLVTLGVGTLSAALFVFAEIVSGGSASALAPFLFAAGGAVSVGQAAASWKDYSDLATANTASINPEEELVSGTQVDEALRAAVLDSVFAVMDGWQVVKSAGTAVRGGKGVVAGNRAGREAGIRNLLHGFESAADKAELVSRAVAEVGPEATQRLTGKPYDVLIGIVGAESAAAKALKVASKPVSAEAKALLEKAPQLAKLDAIEGEQVLAAIVQSRGYIGALEVAGGWGALRKMEAMRGETGKTMEAWRTGITKELERYVARESEGMTTAIRTGTEEATSDLDVQLVGDAAGELQAKAEGWLGGRLGTSPKKAKSLLDAEIFIDPTRAHLIDIINSPKITKEVREQIGARMHEFEQRASWSSRWVRANAISPEAGERVVADARAAGAEKMIDRGFQIWSRAEQKAVAKDIDRLMITAAKTKDPKLIEEIAQKQARINASHSDAYVGGGVRVWVTGREVDAAKFAEILGTSAEKLAAVTTRQRIMAVLSEGKWLDAAYHSLYKGSGDANLLTKAITNAGKHGERAATVLKAAGAPNAARLELLANTLAKYKGMTAEEVSAIIARGELRQTANQICVSLDMLRDATSKGVKALRDEVKVLGLPTADLTGWAVFEANYRAGVEGLKGATWGAVREIEAFAQAGTQSSIYNPPPQESVGPPPPKPASTPEQSVAPQPWEEPQSIP